MPHDTTSFLILGMYPASASGDPPPRSASPCAVNAVTEIGVSCRLSSRLRAVTTTSSSALVTVSDAFCAAAVCGTAPSAMTPQTAAASARERGSSMAMASSFVHLHHDAAHAGHPRGHRFVVEGLGARARHGRGHRHPAHDFESAVAGFAADVGGVARAPGGEIAALHRLQEAAVEFLV